MSQTYWSRIARERLSRRRVLAASGATIAATALLAACGSGSSKSGSSGAEANHSSLVAVAEDTSKQAKRGGSVKTSITTDANAWDPYFTGAWFGTLGAVVFSRLTIVKPGIGRQSSGEIGGDLAEGWEFSPDGLTMTYRLRQNAHWHDVPPVGARLVDTQDVVASWNRWRVTSGTRTILDHDASPDAPVLSLAAPDNRTIVVKLAYPNVTLPGLMSGNTGQSFHILPREAGDGYNPRNTPIGSGPYALSEQVQSSRLTFKRNPGYYDSDHPYSDLVEYPIVTEYATGMAALRSGQLYTFAVRPEDVVDTKKAVSDLNMFETDITRPSANMFFGYRPSDKAPFRDKRLRQAFSMALDRDLFAETWFNVSKFTSQGLPVNTAWSSVVPCDEYNGWWLDPQGKDFGPNAKFYQHNVAEAKKLVAAAGFANGVDYVSTRAKGNYGPEYDREIDIMEGMAAEAGFKPTSNGVDYTTVLIPQFEHVHGDFEGVGWMLRPQSSSDPIEKLAEYTFSGSGGNFIGMDPDGKGTFAGDPFVDDLIRKSRSELDGNKRKQMMADLQRHMADGMYVVRPPSGATGFSLAWPALRNFNYFRGDPRTIMYYWIDETQKPIVKA